MNSALTKLRESAINLKIESNETIDKVVSLDSLIKILTDINISFKRFAEFELKNHNLYKEYLQKKPKILEDFLESLNLLIVDAKIGSFQTALAPNIFEENNPLFKDEVLEFKRDIYINYKDDVVYLDYQNQSLINKIINKYPDEIRVNVYSPFFKALSVNDKYSISILDKNNNSTRRILLPDKLRIKQIIPEIKPQMTKKKEQFIKGYFKINTIDNKIELKKSNIKKVLDIEILEHETYPFKPDTIRFENHVFILNNKLNCNVEFVDDLYFINNDILNISVWGSTREEVEEAFNFAFYSLYINYVEDFDTNLSHKAIELKQKIKSLIKSYFNESTQSKRTS